jgi:hypothetical protein
VPTTTEPASEDPPAPDPPRSDAERRAATALGETARRAPLHARDQVPRFILKGQAWLYRWLPNESRLLLSLVIVVLAVVAAFILSSSRVLRFILDGLDVVAIVGLFMVNWLGNGGALVPIPGARFIGLLLIFQQAVILPSWEVFSTAGAAMALGLLTYYIAGARTAQSYADGDTDEAEELAQETGMLDEDADEFSPGADLDAMAVSAIAGVDAADGGDDDAAAEDAASSSRLGRFRQRFATSLRRTQARAEPILTQRGSTGMFLLCFAPTPLSTAGAYVGGLMRFGFKRYLVASFAAKYLLAGVIVVLALTFSSTAESVAIPELHIPVINVTLFDDGDPAIPRSGASPAPSPVSSPSE